MPDFNVRAALTTQATDSDTTDRLTEALLDYSPAIALGPTGYLEVTITLPATNLRQAVSTALTLLAERLDGHELLTLEVLPTDEFDARAALVEVPSLCSVEEAAKELGISRQAVGRAVREGRIPAERIGTGYAIARANLAGYQVRQRKSA